MSDRWVARPYVHPFSCARTGRTGEEDGPYWEADFHYHHPDDKAFSLRRLYLSRESVRTMLNAEGSPFAPVEQDDLAILRHAYSQNQGLIQERDELREQVADLSARLGEQARDVQGEVYDTFRRALADHEDEKTKARMAKARAARSAA